MQHTERYRRQEAQEHNWTVTESGRLKETCTDQENESLQRDFFDKLVAHWSLNPPSDRSWTTDGEVTAASNQSAELLFFLKEHASGRMGWKDG